MIRSPSIYVSDKTYQTVNSIFHYKSELSWVILMINNDSTLKVDSIDDGITSTDFNGHWVNFLNYLPENEVRYAVINFEYFSPIDKITRRKRVFIMWAPDGASQKYKLMVSIYSRSVQDELSNGFGYPVRIQTDNISDLSYEAILKKIEQSCCCF